MLDTRGILQRAAKEIFELPEGENDAVREPIRQVLVERRVLARDPGCSSRRDAHMLLRARVGRRHMSRNQPPSRDPLPHEKVSLDPRSLDGDPCIQFGEIDADAAFTGTWTHVNGRAVLRLTQSSLQLRLRPMTDWAVVRRRRAFCAY